VSFLTLGSALSEPQGDGDESPILRTIPFEVDLGLLSNDENEKSETNLLEKSETTMRELKKTVSSMGEKCKDTKNKPGEKGGDTTVTRCLVYEKKANRRSRRLWNRAKYNTCEKVKRWCNAAYKEVLTCCPKACDSCSGFLIRGDVDEAPKQEVGGRSYYFNRNTKEWTLEKPAAMAFRADDNCKGRNETVCDPLQSEGDPCIKKKDNIGNYIGCVSYNDLADCLIPNSTCGPRWDRKTKTVFMQKGTLCDYHYEERCAMEEVFQNQNKEGRLVILVKGRKNESPKQRGCLDNRTQMAFRFPRKICTTNVMENEINIFMKRMSSVDHNRCLVGKFEKSWSSTSCESFLDTPSTRPCRKVKASWGYGAYKKRCDHDMRYAKTCLCSEDRNHVEGKEKQRSFTQNNYNARLKDENRLPDECKALFNVPPMTVKIEVYYDFIFYIRAIPKTAKDTKEKINAYKSTPKDQNRSFSNIITRTEEDEMKEKIHRIFEVVSNFFHHSLNIKIKPVTIQPLFLRYHQVFYGHTWKDAYNNAEECDTPTPSSIKEEELYRLDTCPRRCGFLKPAWFLREHLKTTKANTNGKKNNVDPLFLTGCSNAVTNDALGGAHLKGFCSGGSPGGYLIWVLLPSTYETGEPADRFSSALAHELGHYLGTQHLDASNHKKDDPDTEFLMLPRTGSDDFETKRLHPQSKRSICKHIVGTAIPNTRDYQCLEGCFCKNSHGCKPIGDGNRRVCEVDPSYEEGCQVYTYDWKYYSVSACEVEP